ncbi:MAG: ribosomal protein S18-alanine N-acetyltransferase [Acidimicrobiales bacterium]
MRRRHLRSVLVIEAKVYPRPWSLALFVGELSLRSSRVYNVARVGAEIVGYAGLMLNGEDAHVTTIAVDPIWQRHHVGSRLMLEMALAARSRGIRNLTLEVRVANRGAQALYHQFGFSPAGIRKNYYAETNEDALIMWANDIDSSDYGRRLAEIALAIPGAEVRAP